MVIATTCAAKLPRRRHMCWWCPIHFQPVTTTPGWQSSNQLSWRVSDDAFWGPYLRLLHPAAIWGVTPCWHTSYTSKVRSTDCVCKSEDFRSSLSPLDLPFLSMGLVIGHMTLFRQHTAGKRRHKARKRALCSMRCKGYLKRGQSRRR